jgi:hypothetical protein
VLLGRQRKKKREGSTPAAGLKEFFGPKISLGREENGKRIWNLWLQIWICIKALNQNQRYFQIQTSWNLLWKHKFGTFDTQIKI